MKIPYEHVDYLISKCESYEEFLKRVNDKSKELGAHRVEIKEIGYQIVAFLYNMNVAREL